MKVFITTPSFGLHGGIRIIVELANRLTKWHEVYLHSLAGNENIEYWDINPGVKIVGSDMGGMDCLIVTSPHSIHFQNRPDCPDKVFLHCQMAEHLFNKDRAWQLMCREFYTSKHPMLSISKWNIDLFRSEFKRTGETHYIGNGVNFDHFPIEKPEKDGKVVLVEGWEARNPAKDVNKIAPVVAHRLKRDGYTIVAYGATPLRTLGHVPQEYYQKPSLEKINELYSRATILLKASKYDARSCSPVEAGTKYTVTARAIIQGDDDLIDGVTCLKTPYNEMKLYKAAKALLTDHDLRNKLADGMAEHLKANNWDSWMKKINQIICD